MVFIMKHAGKEIRCLSHQIARTLDPMHSEITRTQGRMLHYLNMEGEHRDLYQKDLEIAFHLRRSSATELLQKLESVGMIVRTNDEKDRRQKKIVLTQKGREQDLIIGENIQAFETALQKGIKEEELAVFYRVIEKMMENCIAIQKEQEENQ